MLANIVRKCTGRSRSAPLTMRKSSVEKRRGTRPEKFPAISGFLLFREPPDFNREYLLVGVLDLWTHGIPNGSWASETVLESPARCRIGAHDVDAADRDIRKQVPIDSVAKGLIDPNARRTSPRRARQDSGDGGAVRPVGPEIETAHMY
jgi:hypothetical protein